MIAFLIRRVIQAVIVVILVLLGVFLLSHVIPGGAARAALGPRATNVQIRQFNVANNYYKAIFVQFWLYLKALVWHHNLGYSYKIQPGRHHGHRATPPEDARAGRHLDRSWR